jgi:hypothetical protein
MIYLIFEKLNPLIPILIICPLIAIIIGISCALFRANIFFCICIAFLLPLLFIANNMSTFKANFGAWVLYGVIYGLITFTVFKVITAIRS